MVAAAQADGTIDFGFYPTGSQKCLDQAAATSKCQSSTVAATNSCLCRNGGNFITLAAACIGKSSPGDLKTVYSTMSGACTTSATPISINEDDFMAAANAATSTTTTSTKSTSSQTSSKTTSTSSTSSTSTTSATSASATTTDATTGSSTGTGTGTATATTSTATQTGDNQGGQASSGLSTAVIAGIVVGAIGGIALLAGFAYFMFRRGKKAGEESHPMLPQHSQPSSMHFGRESTAYYGSPPTTGTWPKKEWGPSPDPQTGSFNWESPAHLAHLSYPAGTLAPSPPPPAAPMELDASQHLFPTGSTAAAAEMGGTPVATTAPPNPQYQPYNQQPQQQQQQQYPAQQQQQQQQQQYPGQPQYPGQQQYPGGAAWHQPPQR